MLNPSNILPHDREVAGEEGEWYVNLFYYTSVGVQVAPGLFPDPVESPTREEYVQTARSEQVWAKVWDGNKITQSAAAIFPTPPFTVWGVTPQGIWREVSISTWAAQGQYMVFDSVGADIVTLIQTNSSPEFESDGFSTPTSGKPKRETPMGSSGTRVKPLLGAPYGPVLAAYIGADSWVYPYPWPRTTRSGWRDPETQYGTFAGMVHCDQYSDTHYLLTFWNDLWSFGGREVFPEYTAPLLQNQLYRTETDHAIFVDGRRWKTHMTRL
jgi:hypothetical protein